jgi:hypothetical protein
LLRRNEGKFQFPPVLFAALGSVPDRDLYACLLKRVPVRNVYPGNKHCCTPAGSVQGSCQGNKQAIITLGNCNGSNILIGTEYMFSSSFAILYSSSVVGVHEEIMQVYHE